jgi:flagellum-specific peptidoglycan hydrolase FlgJ
MIQRSAKFGTQAEKGKILGLIDREMTQLTMQKVRSLLASTSATKLNSYGGATEKISRMLLRDVDSSVQEKSVIAVAEQMERYFYRKAANLVKGFTDDEIALAVSINRGKQITKDTPQKIINLSNNIKSYLDEVKTLHSDAGFFAKKELADYFPRVLNWDKINRDPEKFRTTLESIYKSLDFKDPKKAADQYISGHRVAGDSVFNRQIMETIFGVGAKKGVSKEGKKFIYTPVSDHIMHERSLVGPYKLVEEVLEKNGYLVNDAAYILSNLVNKSVKSIAFARQFGTNGELLQPLFQQIKNKYSKSGLKTEAANKAAIKESNLVIDTIDAYFDRYGQKLYGAASGSASILATLSNLNMLGRVTISSLGDLIQPFQNSSQFKSIVKGWMQTSRTAKNETGLAKALNYDINNELQKALIRSAGIGEGDVVNATRWMGIKNPTQTLNNAFFKGLGLQWLTGYARRFAYNTGTADAYYLSKQLYNIVNKGAGINSNKAQRVINFLQKYGINSRQGLQIGEVKSFNETIKISANKKLLEQAGIITANRDALIPQVSNRLLFTQNQNQWIRIWGQFLSWAMAKSAQTNKILARIENGNAKTLVKTLAVLPLYSGVQSLRELAKHGEVVTDYTANNKKWWAEGGRLSGMIGWLPELVANRFVGPGSREPWYAFAPFFQTITAPIDAAYQGFFKGNKDRALQIISNKIAPLPNWRRLFSRLFSRGPKEIQTGTNFSGGELKPFSVGGAVAKAVTKNIIDRGKTAITTTTGTYTKANKILTDLNKKTVHDFGSGKGVGTKEFKNKIVTSHEPFVSDEAILKAGGKLPDYKNVKDLFKVEGANSKDSVVNLNVLNVIENVSERVKVVDQIGKLLNKDGVAIITTRGDDVLNQAKKSKNAIKYLDGFLFGGKEKTFQKGYNQKELELFIKTVLGDNFKIEKIPSKYKINTSGVIIKKIKDSFNTGGEVIVPPKKPDLESQLSDAMKIDTTTGEGANINVIEEKKSNVDKQVEKATKKDYSKLPDLDENKKNFLLDTAKTIFTNNRENSVPNDVLLSIAIEETGYGEGRFYKQGNNLFSLVAEKGDERIKAKGDETVVAKFENPSGSINKFYSWVDNKPHYQIVRDTIQLYNEGKASKEDIIDAISSTGWAENKDWSSNVKSILKKRVDGKHKDELQKLADSLFSE